MAGELLRRPVLAIAGALLALARMEEIMAQLEKYNIMEAMAIFAHCERTGATHSNECIDMTRTKDNYALWPLDQPDRLILDTGIEGQSSAHYAYKRMKKRLSQVSCLKRKDVNILCDWCIHLGIDVPPGYESARSFFEAAVRYIADLYGEKNILYAWVHMDEGEPHIHVGFVPIVKKPLKLRKNASDETKKAHEEAVAAGRTSIERVDADALITRRHLQGWHPRFSAWMTEELGYDPAVHTGITEALGGNLSVKQLKKKPKDWAEKRQKQTDAFHAKRRAEKTGRKATLTDQVTLATNKKPQAPETKRIGGLGFDIDTMINKAKGRSGCK